MGIGDWGLGIGDWGLGIGPNPQSPIPNPHPQSPIKVRKDELQLIKKINLTIFMINVFELKKLILDLNISSRDT
jgi:hypothetical protein